MTTKKEFTLTLLIALVLTAACRADKAGGSVFHDMATPRMMKSTFPKYSDVTTRTLTIRDVPFEDEKNIFRAAPAFHVTRIDWSYLWLTERELNAVKKLNELGYTYCGSAAQHIPCWIGDRAPVDWKENIVMADIEGNESIMPFIRPWKNPQLIGDISNPVYYAGHLEYYKKLIDAGCYNLQRDAANHHLLAVTTTGGGFTDTGVAGFSRWLAEHLDTPTLKNLGIDDPDHFNYRDYLIEKGAPVGDDFSRKYTCPIKKYWYRYWEKVSIDFFSRLVRDIKAYAGRDIPISVNNTSFQQWDELSQLFDFGMSELMMVSANPNHLWERQIVAEKLDKFQVVGSAKLLGLEVIPEEKTALDKKVIATMYALGGIAKVPWDTFEQTKDGGGRFFGKPEDYAPIFGFIRGISSYLDGYDRAYDYSTAGILSAGVAAEDKPLEIEATENEVCAFVRVNIQDPAGPVAVHLVDWGKALVVSSRKGADEVWELASGEAIYEYVKGMENLKRSTARSFELVIREDAFEVPAESLTFKLLTPGPYDAALHQEAEQKKNYSLLVSEKPIECSKQNGTLRLTIPALKPWGVLLIQTGES